jgi:hypothetical protein
VAPTHPLPVVRYRMTTSCASPAALASAVASDGDHARIHLGAADRRLDPGPGPSGLTRDAISTRFHPRTIVNQRADEGPERVGIVDERTDHLVVPARPLRKLVLPPMAVAVKGGSV